MVRKDQIILFLKQRIIASGSQIARALKAPYHHVYDLLLRLWEQGIVDRVVRYEKFPGSINYVKVKYWFLKENEHIAKKLLGIEK